ncbi:CHAD domain-containing protein [Streptomyces sp. NPDC012510]|uniref:CHAD domain-containing protein n=1 Tax=Streptomyces sp. NPDC012510 TaxID=3364838 RepID=UPI0036ED3669
MAQRHLDPTNPTAVPADALAGYLRAQATEFLRALRTHRETGGGAAGGAEGSTEAALALRRSARRISGTLHTFRPLLDADWSESLRPELAWLSGTLGHEHAYAARLDRLVTALHRLSGATAFPTRTATTADSAAGGSQSAMPARSPASAVGGRITATSAVGGRSTTATSTAGDRAASAAASAVGSRSAGAERVGTAGPGTAGPGTHPPATPAPAPHTPATPDRGNLTVGAAKAGALLDRRLTLARTRAHSAALQALGSSRFHAVADRVAVLASEVPLTPAAPATDLRPLAAAAHDRLRDAVTVLPLHTAGHPYNAEALIHGISPDTAPHPQDAPWHQVRLLLRLHRYALEVLHPEAVPVDLHLLAAGEALNRHRDAAEAASAAASAARTPRIAPATAYALGVLHADQRHEVEASRFAFQQSWQKEAVSMS